MYDAQLRHLNIHKTCPVGHSSSLYLSNIGDASQAKTLDANNEPSKIEKKTGPRAIQ